MINEDAKKDDWRNGNQSTITDTETATVWKALYHALKGLGCFKSNRI